MLDPTPGAGARARCRGPVCTRFADVRAGWRTLGFLGMSDEQPSTAATGTAGESRITPAYTAPPGASATLTWSGPDGPVEVAAEAGWTVLRRKESPAAEVFSVTYTLDGPDRPVTFVFNGGPGASSAYLHVGALGPRRVAMPDDGTLPAAPMRLVDNAESWLPFTDLVFIDPVGTGFSRRISLEGESPDDAAKAADTYWGFSSDLVALREFMGRWLSDRGRWTAPVLLAGESYGGYRVGRLARSLQEDEGVGLVGAVLISPAVELTPLTATDYSIEAFIDVLPSMAAAAHHHGRLGVEAADGDEAMALAASFATDDYVRFLARGSAMPADERERVMARLAALTGLPEAVVGAHQGRIPITTYVRELLRDRQEVVGLYDATLVGADPFPDRDPFGGADPTLAGATAAFTAAVNQVLRAEIGVRSDRRYELLSLDVNKAWKRDDDSHALDAPAGATDDLRYGLALNPHMRVLITHGRHDLVTPAHSSTRLRDLMRLGSDAAERVELRRYDGGHMYYTHRASREASTRDAAAFVASCLPGAAGPAGPAASAGDAPPA